MRATIGILAVIFFIASGAEGFGETASKQDYSQNSDYLVDGLMYRGEGNCVESLKNYQMARKLKQFKEDWIYHLAVVDCFVALKRFDDAIDSYTKVIESTANRTLQAEMYKGRARAYYLKSVKPDGIDLTMVDLAKKDLESAEDLGVDVSDLRKNIRDDMERKTARTFTEGKEEIVITAKPVTLIESPGKIIIGNGEYILYPYEDTIIKDQQGMSISASDIKPGDLIDFSYTMSYLNKADGMLHISAKTITLHRDVAPKPAAVAAVQEKVPDTIEMLIFSKLNMLAGEIKDLKEEMQAAAKEPEKPKAKKKTHKKSSATEKKPPKKTQPEGEIK
jgi:tetratricopeptide (TPR) repeat protein